MKYVVNIFKKDNQYIAECKDLGITAIGKDIIDVKINFVQTLVIYSKEHNTFIDFIWNTIDK